MHELFDASGEPDVQARTLRSERAEAVLEAAGFTPIGALGVKMAGQLGVVSMHPLMTDHRIPVWRSANGASVAEVERLYGVDSVELHTLLEDGTIVRTRWASVAGGVPLGWMRGDPRRPPETGVLARMQSSSVDKGEMAAAQVDKAAGLFTQRTDELTPEATLAAHDALVREVGGGLPIVPLDVSGLVAVERRALEIFMSNLHTANFGKMGAVIALMALPMMLFPLAMFGAMDDFFVATQTSEDPTIALQSLVDGMAAPLGLMLGFSLGVVVGTTRGLNMLLALSLAGSPLLFLGFKDVSVGSESGAPGLLSLAVAGWAVLGFLGAVALGRLGVPALQRLVSLERLAGLNPLGRLLGRADPVARMPAAEVLETYGGGVGSSRAVPTAPEVGSAADAVLTRVGFRPLGAREESDRNVGAQGAPLVARATVWCGPDGATVAETRRVGEDAFVCLRSRLSDGVIVETRTLPDPGPLERAVVREVGGGAVPTRPVTARALGWQVIWPTSAVMRVADRPAARLRVRHVGTVQEALEGHAAWIAEVAGGATPEPCGSLDDAVAWAAMAKARRPTPSGELARFGTATTFAMLGATLLGWLVPGLGALSASYGPMGFELSGDAFDGVIAAMMVVISMSLWPEGATTPAEAWRRTRTPLLHLFAPGFAGYMLWSGGGKAVVVLVGTLLVAAVVARVLASRELAKATADG